MKIQTREEFERFKLNHQGKIANYLPKSSGFEINHNGQKIEFPQNCQKWLSENSTEYANDLIFGKDKTLNVVSIEVKDGNVYIYTETNGIIHLEVRQFKYWIMSNIQPNGIYTRMDGNLHFKYLKEFDTEKEYKEANSKLYVMKADKYCCYDFREAYMIRHGLTYFKGMKVEDVSVLSFDLETEGIDAETCKTLMISNTVRKAGQITKKLFSLDEYKNELSMIQAWTEWVREIDPSVMIGHNIYAFDFKFLKRRVEICGKSQVGINKNRGLCLGRDGSPIDIATKTSQFRYDGSQQYDFNKINIWGRNVIDTFFLVMKYDVGREFSAYGLKTVISELGMEREGRIKWDFTKNKPRDFFGKYAKLTEQFKEYCRDDSDDSLKIYDKMISAYFYTNVSIPKTFTGLMVSATGAWINSFLCRGYIGVEHSIPKTMEQNVKVHGGISFGIPGVYKNLNKIDVASEYPSVIRQFKIHPRTDILGFYNLMVDYFTEARFADKRKFKETGDKYYDDLQGSKKIFINSSYGLLACPGLNFNDYDAANQVTGISRQVIRNSLKWACGKDVGDFMEYDYSKDSQYVNKIQYTGESYDFIIGPTDTDSISFCKKDMSPFTEEERKQYLKEINEFLPEKIRMEDDGVYPSVVVVAAKNYILNNGKKIKFKGSSLTDGKKEPALLEMVEKIGLSLLNGIDYPTLQSIYTEYIKEALSIKDIHRWAVKKTVTKPVLESANDPEARANEFKVWDAIKHTKPQEGDKVFLYNTIDGEKQKVEKGELQFKRNGEPKMVPNCILKLADEYTNDIDVEKLIKRVWDTLEIFETVIDINQFINYSKKVNVHLLEKLK